MKDYTVAVLGVGAWGKNILKTVADLCSVGVLGYSGSTETKQFLGEHYPSIQSTSDIKAIAQNDEIDAVFIATPIELHFQHVKLFLESGKHVFVEKPLALTVAEVDSLYALADEKNLTLYTGYIYLHDQAVESLRNITQDTQGSLEMIWEKWGSFKSPITTNLLVHEIALSHYLLGEIQSITSEKIQEDYVKLHLQHKQGESHIHIDRKNKSKRKYLRFTTNESTAYTVENQILTKEETGKNIVLSNTQDEQLLHIECQKFLEVISSGSAGNKKRQQIDISVALVLQKLS